MRRVEITLKSGVTVMARVEEFSVQNASSPLLPTTFTWKHAKEGSRRELLFLDIADVAAVVYTERKSIEGGLTDG